MKKGFTLIELLVVIAIIGILASVVLVAVNSYRINTRDAERMHELDQIQKALETYWERGAQAYPDPGGDHYCQVSQGLCPTLETELAEYLNPIPGDPIDDLSQWKGLSDYDPDHIRIYAYCYCSDDSFTLYTNLEGTTNDQCTATEECGCGLHPYFNYCFSDIR